MSCARCGCGFHFCECPGGPWDEDEQTEALKKSGNNEGDEDE